VFTPIFKRIRWGGRRLSSVLGKSIGPEDDYAESWEVSDHGDDQSVVCTGSYEGWTLSRLVREQNLPLFGRHAGLSQFPLLIKYLDANEALSVQVHPDDQLAKEFDPTENGKTEAWVILAAEPDSRLYVGLQQGVSEADLRAAIAEGDLERLLHSFVVQPGDCVFVPAGTVHAIGAGVLLAEVQQSSDITFRLYDWNRVGADGRPRELHVERALRCIDFSRGPVNPVTPRPISSAADGEQLVNSEYFAIDRYRNAAPFSLPSGEEPHVLMALSGSGRLKTSDGSLSLTVGQTVLLPAEREAVRIEPIEELTILDAYLP
jgi:mannose-6-phosphate isomerase